MAPNGTPKMEQRSTGSNVELLSVKGNYETTKGAEEPLSGLDNFFCIVEGPQNLMNIAGLWIFDQSLDLGLVREELEAMCNRFPRFRQRVIEQPGGHRLFKDYDFRLDDHIFVEDLSKPSTTTPEPSSKRDEKSQDHDDEELLRLAVSRVMSIPLSESKALWEAHIFTNLNSSSSSNEEDPTQGSSSSSPAAAILIRLHHCITDGQGSIRAILTLTSLKSELGLPPTQYGGHSPQSSPSSSSSSTSSTSSSSSKSSPRAPRKRERSLLERLQRLITFFLFTLPTMLLGLLYALWTLLKVTLFTRRSLRLDGVPEGRKEVAWSQGIDLEDVKLIKNTLGGTVNDVLVACLHRAICSLLSTSPSSAVDSQLLYAIPVSLRKPDDWSLTNKAATAFLFLPNNSASASASATPSAKELTLSLKQTRARLDALKRSPEPVIGYELYSRILRYPSWFVHRPLLDHYLNKIHAVLTNVPGPLHHFEFAGRRVVKYVPVIPQPNPDGGLGLGILSYAGKVVVSIHTQEYQHSGDKHLPGGPKALAQAFQREFQALLLLARKQVVSASPSKSS